MPCVVSSATFDASALQFAASSFWAQARSKKRQREHDLPREVALKKRPAAAAVIGLAATVDRSDGRIKQEDNSDNIVKRPAAVVAAHPRPTCQVRVPVVLPHSCVPNPVQIVSHRSPFHSKSCRVLLGLRLLLLHAYLVFQYPTHVCSSASRFQVPSCLELGRKIGRGYSSICSMHFAEQRRHTSEEPPLKHRVNALN